MLLLSTTNTEQIMKVSYTFPFIVNSQYKHLQMVSRIDRINLWLIRHDVGPMIRVARNYILQAAGEYDSMDYWLKRSQIGTEMLNFLQNNLGPNIFVEVRMFQLLNVELPPKYEQSIINTQVLSLFSIFDPLHLFDSLLIFDWIHSFFVFVWYNYWPFDYYWRCNNNNC